MLTLSGVCVGRAWQEVIATGEAETGWARQLLVSKFKGRWVALACDRFGCWTVEKMFAAVDIAKKVRAWLARGSCCCRVNTPH